MALMQCSECGRTISDQAAACPGCGAPPPAAQATSPHAAMVVGYDRATCRFSGTLTLVVKLAMRAVQHLGWTITEVNEAVGFVGFQTPRSMGSWSGISGSLNIDEISPGQFKVVGTGKQNVSGMQLGALDLGEAKRKAEKAISKMKELAAEIL